MVDTSLEIKKNRDKYEVRTFTSNRKGANTYFNVIDKNPVKLAQVLMDIELIDDFPVEKAIKIYLQRKKKGDWLSM